MTRREFLKEMVAAFRVDCKGILDSVELAEAGHVIAEVEFEVRRKALRRYAQVFAQAVQLRAKTWERKLAPVCSCGNRMRMINRMPKRVLSILGELRFKRRHYYCDACGVSRWPFDEAMARLRALMYSTGSWDAFWSDRQLRAKAG